MDDCVFCKIINGEIPYTFLYQDEKIVAFRDISPKADIHVLVVPRQHIKSLAEINASHSQLLSHLMLALPKIAQAEGMGKGFRTIINTGADGGQEIAHLHMHILGGKKLPGF